MTLEARVLSGPALEARLDEVAALRMTVFREWPYLYEGSMDYERAYLATYRTSPDAILVGAFDGERLVGAATGTPMEDHAEDFAAAFSSTGIPLREIFYCAESVLLPAWRGRGMGHRFFDLREDHARRLGRRYSAFCSVIRPEDHPLRPARARSNEPFWRGRGYRPMPGIIASFSWTDVGEDRETKKPLQFWIREL
ncbi:GNAT family N-acetyltransferase [Cereibacter sphaeroides]|uniref:GNAT family N-acetyltransferase n=1 Tax=Cereibacter sphaeroides TaxID=1063 RepID=UPI001F28DFE2|nr:GNAT family N-acetyltransferase [Cereibacter sphaeroides]MCE6951674.1 GNAT family N-acetyltransferase [Cereibacter sphaeroides]MCE6969187.1 GNAT family N-acetyltransferase [Cereibacter sphaeroides]